MEGNWGIGMWDPQRIEFVLEPDEVYWNLRNPIRSHRSPSCIGSHCSKYCYMRIIII